jgi:sodium-dependent dicarboxylate transporter 2/3/5
LDICLSVPSLISTHFSNFKTLFGFCLGPTLFFILSQLPEVEGLSTAGLLVAGITCWMACWWIFEVIPLAATALLPIILFPLLGIQPIDSVSDNYANPILFLFLGGFLIAIAIERCQLHQRIALLVLRVTGTHPVALVGGFMFVTAFLSSWISNTAATMMMITIATAVLMKMGQNSLDANDDQLANLAVALMLGIAYSASIGGVATLIGSPPNAIFAAVLSNQFGITISFFDWMLFALPLSLSMLVIAGIYLTWKTVRSHQLPRISWSLADELAELGPISSAETRVLLVFLMVATGWMTRGMVDWPWLQGLSDSTIAIAGAVILFILPSGDPGRRLLQWSDTQRLPWDILLLFGGGLALADGVASSGLSTWLGLQLTGLSEVPIWLMILVLTLMVIFLTEVTSNTATASLLLPIIGGVAQVSDIPAVMLMVPVTLAASFAFMLPVATPPNAIVFSTRLVSLPQMIRAGIWLNLISTLAIGAMVYWFLPIIWQWV